MRKKIYILILLLSIIGYSCKETNYHIPTDPKRISTGLEIFIKKHAEDYEGKKAILITNHSGVDFHLNRNLELLRGKGINVFMIMAPEHGIYGYQNEYDKRMYLGDDNNNTIIYNLHKLNKKSFRFLSKKADIVIFDIQDMGMSCLLYTSPSPRDVEESRMPSSA